jgi:hypothetical protein
MLIVSVWIKCSIFALLWLIKAAVYLRGPLNVRAEQWWNDNGQRERRATQKQNFALMPFYHYQEHMKSPGTEPRFLWYETRVLNNPHEKCFKEIYPKRRKKRIEELNDKLIRLICYKVSRMLAFQTVFYTLNCYNINSPQNQFFMTL